jgi:hypothetical protein
MLDYRHEERGALIEQQRRITGNPPLVRWMFDRLNAFVDARLAEDVRTCFPAKQAAPATDLIELR